MITIIALSPAVTYLVNEGHAIREWVSEGLNVAGATLAVGRTPF